MRNRSLAQSLLGAYLGLAPIYWLPGMPAILISSVKYFLFLGAFFVIVLGSLNRGRVSVSRSMLGPVGLIVILTASIPGLLQQGVREAAILLESYSTIFIAMWMGGAIGKSEVDSIRLLRIAVLITCGFTLLWLLLVIAGVGVNAPESMRSLSLRAAGFGAGRTGWSNGIAMAAAVSFALAVSFRSVNDRSNFQLYAVAGSILCLGQVAIAGRAGILGSVVALFVAIAIWRRGSVALLFVATLALFTAVWLYEPAEAGRQGRFDLSVLGGGGIEALDTISSGRISTYIVAIGEIAQRPLSGYGFGDWEANHAWGDAFVHNVWLRMAYQGGLLFLVANGLLMAQVVRLAVATLRRGPRPLSAAAVCVFSALVISMLEPSYPIGTFQTSALMWVVVGMMGSWKSHELRHK